jgi:hypothetical protein
VFAQLGKLLISSPPVADALRRTGAGICTTVMTTNVLRARASDAPRSGEFLLVTFLYV